MMRNIPTLALLLTFTIYVDVSLDGVDSLIGALIRGIIQRLVIYAIALWIIKKLKYPVVALKKQSFQNIPSHRLN
jgi:hypothetical protein